MSKRKVIAIEKLTCLVKEKIDSFMKKLSSEQITDDFRAGFALGRDFSMLTSTLFETFRFQLLPPTQDSSTSEEVKKMIALNEKLQKTFFGEIININEYVVEEEVEDSGEKSNTNI